MTSAPPDGPPNADLPDPDRPPLLQPTSRRPWTRARRAVATTVDRLRNDERLLAICGSTILVMAGQGVVGPVLPVYARNFGVSTAVVGLTLTTFGLARLVLNVPAGVLADRAGRRSLLIGGPLITAVGMIGSGLAPSIWILLLWRMVAGAGSALYMTGAQIYLIDIAGNDQRARYMATNQAALLLGVTVGPAIGGLLADAVNLQAPFLVVGAGAALTAVYGFLRLPETAGAAPGAAPGPGSSPDPGRTPVPVDSAVPVDTAEPPSTEGVEPPGSGVDDEVITDRRSLLRSRRFLAVGAVSFAVFAVRSGYRLALFPLAAVEDFGFTTGQVGLLFAVTGLIGVVLINPAGWAADRFGRRPVILVPGVFAAVGVLISAAAGGPVLFVAGSVVVAIGTSVAGPAPAAYVADLAPPHLRGAAMGLYRTTGDLGIVVSPLLAGLLADATSISWGMVAIGTVMTLALAWFWIAGTEATATNQP